MNECHYCEQHAIAPVKLTPNCVALILRVSYAAEETGTAEMANISLVVAWIFVAVFVITVIIALLDLSQIIKIRDPARRKWLFGTLIVSIVMPVVTFGTRNFDGSAVAETAIKKTDANVERMFPVSTYGPDLRL